MLAVVVANLNKFIMEKYRGYIIEENPYKSLKCKNSKWLFYHSDDDEDSSGHDASIQGCREQIDKIIDFKIVSVLDSETKIIDSHGKIVSIGDKVRGSGFISFQDGFKIDRTPVVTVRKNEQDGTIYFGNLSMKSFNKFWLVKDFEQ